jgi:hypothetical protein
LRPSDLLDSFFFRGWPELELAFDALEPDWAVELDPEMAVEVEVEALVLAESVLELVTFFVGEGTGRDTA